VEPVFRKPRIPEFDLETRFGRGLLDISLVKPVSNAIPAQIVQKVTFGATASKINPGSEQPQASKMVGAKVSIVIGLLSSHVRNEGYTDRSIST
jgi:hypothetical protein